MIHDVFHIHSNTYLQWCRRPRPCGFITKREWEVGSVGIRWMMFVVGKSFRICWCDGFDTTFKNERDWVEVEGELEKNMQNWSRFECGGARFFLWPTYHKYKNSWEHVWVKYGFWKRNKQINTYTSYHQTAHIKTVSRERKPINIPKTTSSLTLPESVWDGPSLPGHGLATPGFLGWQEKRKELVR